MSSPRVVQSGTGGTLAATSVAASLLQPVQPRRVLVAVVVAVRALGAPTLSISDGVSQVWVEELTTTFDTGLRRLSVFTTLQTTEVPLTITATASASSALTLIVAEIAQADPSHRVYGALAASGTGTNASLTLDPQVENGFVLGVLSHAGANLGLTLGAGYSLVAKQEDPAVSPPLLLEAKVATGVAPLTVDVTVAVSALWALASVALGPFVVPIPGVGLIIAGGGARYAVAPSGQH